MFFDEWITPISSADPQPADVYGEGVKGRDG
jgi:hypothetical protein